MGAMSEPIKRPWSYRPREKVCQCGAVFIAFGNRSKYCKQCAAEVARKRRAEYRKRKRITEKKPEPYIHTCDTPEQMRLCLNCTKRTCNFGECKTVKAAGRTWHRSSQEEIRVRREKAIELRRHGWTYAKIADELGCTEGVISSDFRFMRNAGVEI